MSKQCMTGFALTGILWRLAVLAQLSLSHAKVLFNIDNYD